MAECAILNETPSAQVSPQVCHLYSRNITTPPMQYIVFFSVAEKITRPIVNVCTINLPLSFFKYINTAPASRHQITERDCYILCKKKPKKS